MQNGKKTKAQLIQEIEDLRRRIEGLEKSRGGYEGEVLRIIRASTPIGLFIIQDGKFMFVNEAFLKDSGLDAPDLVGTGSLQFVHPDDREMVRESAIKMLKGQSATPYTYRFIGHDGRIRRMLEGVVSIQYMGKRAVLGHSMDITETSRAQEQLTEAYEKEKSLRQELEAEFERRVFFTRALVHELKTPLTPVLASSELLASELTEEPYLSLAKNIHRGATNLNRRIDELLDLARIEIGMLQMNLRSVDSYRLLSSIGEEMKAMVTANGQTLTLSVSPSLPMVWADEERLHQVVLNLLINASKFTPEGGNITLRARAEADKLVVDVEDTGTGIPQEEQSQLFQPYHLHVNDKEHLSGLGIGLALCKYLVELQGGTISVRSEVGKGSTFSFSIPLAPAS